MALTFRDTGSVVRRLAARGATGLLDAVLPPLCLSCGAAVGAHGTLCPACWDRIDFIGAPMCAMCGLPFDYDVGPGALCGACTRRAPDYGLGRAVMRYDDDSRRLVLGFKHGDRTHGAPAYGTWMARAGADLLGKADVIAPVPLHWRRLWRRRYNQSALLASATSRVSGVPLMVDALTRRRPTRSQGGLSRAARQRNVRGAFMVTPGRRDRVEGRSVLLVDDVLTTGATADSCARTLTRAGAGVAGVLVLCRVVRDAME